MLASGSSNSTIQKGRGVGVGGDECAPLKSHHPTWSPGTSSLPCPGAFYAGTSGGQRASVSQITGCWLGKNLCPLGPASVLWPDGFGSSLSLSEAYNPHQMFHITQCEKPPILSDFLQVHTSVETRYSIFHSASWMSL